MYVRAFHIDTEMYIQIDRSLSLHIDKYMNAEGVGSYV